MTSFTKQYVLTIRLYIERFLLLKTATILSIQIIAKLCFKIWTFYHQQMLYLNFLSFFLIPPHPISYFFVYIDLYIPKMYFHDNYVLRIQQYCMHEFTVVYVLFVYLLCASPNKKEKNVSFIYLTMFKSN